MDELLTPFDLLRRFLQDILHRIVRFVFCGFQGECYIYEE
jgi:hypothetical protein